MNRFLHPSLLLILLLLFSCVKSQEESINEYIVINPYDTVDWGTVLYVPSCSHEHGTSQNKLNNLLNLGIKHVAFSNYYPSKPYYPLEDFFYVPDGIIASPNAEHHSINPFGSFHCNSLGSFYESGSPKGQNPVGMNGMLWRSAFHEILDRLQYEDGGGITINHPSWTRWNSHSPHLSVEDICEMLDYDARVLGIEIYNGTCEYSFDEKLGWDLDTWDTVLKTGRRCWGFCVADHRNEVEKMSGFNVLLCNEYDEHDCLKAYREGRFYGSIHNTSLKFESISLIDKCLTASATDADFLNFVIDGNYYKIDGGTGSIMIPDNAVYARIEAHNAENSLYSNPILFRTKSERNHNTL